MPPTPQLVGPDGRFPEYVVEAVVQHMNDDHAEDTALIARAFSGLPQVDAAEVTDVDATGMEVAVQVAGQSRPARIAFAAPVTDRSGLREEITRLYHAAREELGADEQQPA
ncbi:MAG: DUF2470 domain-containing protein [Nitriliruptoraceae bacterium]